MRRALRNHDDIRLLRASDVMTASPVTVDPQALVHTALALMEDRPSQIYVLPVVDPRTHICGGLIRLHDSKTSGDYARELLRRGSSSYASFRRFGALYDRIIYGAGVCDATEYATLFVAARAITTRGERAA